MPNFSLQSTRVPAQQDVSALRDLACSKFALSASPDELLVFPPGTSVPKYDASGALPADWTEWKPSSANEPYLILNPRSLHGSATHPARDTMVERASYLDFRRLDLCDNRLKIGRPVQDFITGELTPKLKGLKDCGLWVLDLSGNHLSARAVAAICAELENTPPTAMLLNCNNICLDQLFRRDSFLRLLRDPKLKLVTLYHNCAEHEKMYKFRAVNNDDKVRLLLWYWTYYAGG